MGRRQVYRGNPETKQYYLVNDFTGGLNTVDVDDNVRDNELRELLNVDLNVKGLLRNRKGFGTMQILNQILTDNSILIPAGNYRLIKFAINQNNILKILEDYSSLEDFNNATLGIEYKLHVLLVIDDEVYLLKIEKPVNTLGASTVTLTLLHTFSGFTSYGDEKVSIRTVDFLDKIYFPIDKIGTGEVGIGVYDIDDETFTISDTSNGYKPTPYEISKIGFNVLSTDPLNYIEDSGITTKSLQGIFLTDNTGAPITKIPLTGNFKMNIIYTGTNLVFEELDILFKDLSTDLGVTYDSISYVDNGGVFVVTIVGLKVSGVSSEISIEIKDKTGELKFTFVDNSSLVPFNGLSNGDLVRCIKEPNELYKRNTNNNYDESDFSAQAYTLYEYYEEMIAATNPTGYYKVLYPRGIYYYNGVKYTPQDIKKTVDKLEELTLQVSDRIKLTSPDETYQYNGDTTGTLTDFTQITNEDVDLSEFEPLYDIYTVGDDKDTEVVSGIDLSGVCIVEISNSLVYYKENIIWFSEPFQFDYIPNYNFITLPLQVTDEITRIVYFRGAHIIFTKEEIYKMSGTFGTSNFQINLVNGFIGCTQPNTVKSVDNNLIFLSKEGLYWLKSNIYKDGLENVEKIDKKIGDLITAIGRYDSILYNEQYFLIQRDGFDYDAIRYYYNISTYDRQHPFVKDKYAQPVPTFVVEAGEVYTLRGGTWYIYDKGYTDLMPDNTTPDNVSNYIYNTIIETSELMFGYPTHDKKFKSIYIKTLNGEKVVSLAISIKIDGYTVVDPFVYNVVRTDKGEIEYVKSANETLDLLAEGALGQIVLGTVPLGETKQQVHKILVSEKGKNISLRIEQSVDSSFGIQDIGYLHKLGKVRENR